MLTIHRHRGRAGSASVCLLAPVVFFIGLIYARQKLRLTGEVKQTTINYLHLFPTFIVGFLAMALLKTLGHDTCPAIWNRWNKAVIVRTIRNRPMWNTGPRFQLSGCRNRQPAEFGSQHVTKMYVSRASKSNCLSLIDSELKRSVQRAHSATLCARRSTASPR